MLYFKFTQSSHAVIFCTAVFVLPVSSHVVISRAFQGPPLKVRAHNMTSSNPSSSSSSFPLLRCKSGHQIASNSAAKIITIAVTVRLHCSLHSCIHFSFSSCLISCFHIFPSLFSCPHSVLSPPLSVLCFEIELRGNFVSPNPSFQLPNTEY